MNILIVDDESFVRRSLSEMLHTTDGRWTVVGEAENGLQALSLMKQHSVDLVISDIRMPGMDGLELARHIHEDYPDTNTVLLTGYQDFTYARQSLQYGVKDYLVKPTPVDSILELVTKLQNQIEKKKHVNRLTRIHQKNLLEKRLQDLLYGIPLPYFDQTLIPPHTSYVVISVLLQNETTPDGWSEPILYNAIRNISEDWFTPHGQAVSLPEEQEGLILLFSPLTAMEVSPLNDVEMASQFARELTDILKCPFSAGVSCRHEKLDSLSDAYRESLQAARSARKYTGKLAVHYVDIPDAAPPHQLEEQLRLKAKRRVISLMMEVMENRLMEDLSLRTLADELYMNPTYLGRIFKDDIGESFSTILTKLRIRKAMELLGDVKVKVYEVCEQVGFKDPAYFSLIFKKHVGMTPQDYQKQNKEIEE